MSRRVVIAILAVLIIGIVGGTIALVVNRLQETSDSSDEVTPGATLAPADSGSPAIVNPSGDDDGDGLSNAEESIWGTNPSSADTDGDGFVDGEEVRANHNPTIAGPNDTLPENFDPTQDLRPLQEAPVQVDQYFSVDLDLSGGTVNLTEAYQREYPEEQRTPDTLNAFVQQQPIITQLPAPRAEVITVEQSTTPLVLGEYLDIAGDLSVFSAKQAIGQAISALYSQGDAGQILAQASLVRTHQQNVLELRVPPTALNYHKLLLGYTELVASTYEQMALYNDDQVKSVLALRQLEAIDQRYIPLLNQELVRLRQEEQRLLNAAGF